MVVEKRIVLIIIECHLWRQNINFKVFKKNNFIYFLAKLDLHCCMVFSLVVVRGLLIAAASLVAEHGLSFGSCGSQALEHRLNSCGAWA